jgi:hypothetical protein
VRYDEAFGTAPIQHAFRFTVESSNHYAFPASHDAGGTTGALPMGARLRPKASKDLSGIRPRPASSPSPPPALSWERREKSRRGEEGWGLCF